MSVQTNFRAVDMLGAPKAPEAVVAPAPKKVAAPAPKKVVKEAPVAVEAVAEDVKVEAEDVKSEE